jgi:predicted 3-demethylubiquinone-9 3-methyltransferase (glyoxalase superfamily)
LFWLLYHKAEPPASPDYVQKLFDSRYATLPVELRDVHHDEDEVLSIRFTLGGQEFSIMVQKQQGKPDRVDVVQSIVAPTNQK